VISASITLFEIPAAQSTVACTFKAPCLATCTSAKRFAEFFHGKLRQSPDPLNPPETRLTRGHHASSHDRGSINKQSGTNTASTPSSPSEKDGQPSRSTTIDWPHRSWATSVDQAWPSGFNTAKEQAKTPGTARFQAFFLLFFTVMGFGQGRL
jgi:hypothetical protein